MRRLIALAIGIAAVALTAAGQSAPFTITTTSLPAATFGQPYTPVILQTANSAGPMAWSFVPAGSGPTGFVVGSALTGQLDTTGTFCYGFNTQSGPPLCTGNVQAAPGVYNFTLQVTSLSTNQSTTQQFSLAVVLPLQITTSSLPNAAANLAYSVQLQSSGGTGQFSWSIAGGGLPPGIGLDPELGLLSGTAPNATASYTFTVRLQDLATQVTVFRQFTISVVGGLAITTTSLPNAIVNQPYSFQLAAVGATTQVWSVQPGSALPPGFSLSSGGLLTGFGLGTGTFTFGIQVTNPQAAAAITASQIFTFYITLGLLHIVETTIPNA
ncbi:MAG TPA: putative Ig domain-containing protein, partial [Bryobacteraceae bacterium]|nr:putative Ig domain-containing protein [Bryobacteraceae bacterium]